MKNLILFLLFVSSPIFAAQDPICGFATANVAIVNSAFEMIGTSEVTIFSGTVVDLNGSVSPLTQDAASGEITSSNETQLLRANEAWVQYRIVNGLLNPDRTPTALGSNPTVLQNALIKFMNYALHNCRTLIGF